MMDGAVGRWGRMGAVGWAWLAVLAGCASGPTSTLYQGEPPALVDGTITMQSHWSVSDEAQVDTRRVKCRDGKVTAELISRSQGHLVGDVSVQQWESLWAKMFELRPFSDRPRFAEEGDVAQALGPYHLVTLQLGGDLHRFSAQLRRSIFGVFSTGDDAARLTYSDAIAELVAACATTPLAAPVPTGEDPH